MLPSADSVDDAPSAAGRVEERTVERVVADADAHAQRAAAAGQVLDERAEPRGHARRRPVLDLVLDEVGRRLILQPELLHRSCELVGHRRKDRRILRDAAREPTTSAMARPSGGRSGRRPCARPGPTLERPPRRSDRGGAGRIGSASCDCAFFCTSTSLTSSSGDEADTGTLPLSAPHMPLKTSILSLAAMNLPKAASGVPMRSTPRTSSGAPVVGVDAVDEIRHDVERVRIAAARRR